MLATSLKLLYKSMCHSQKSKFINAAWCQCDLQLNEHYKTTKNVCERIGIPTEANAKVLDSLFPNLQNKNDEGVCLLYTKHVKT